MPKDRPANPDQKDLKQLPKPIRLNLPSTRPKPIRRLHEPDTTQQSNKEPSNPKSPPGKEAKKHESSASKRYFDSAQKAYGQRRPSQTKAVKPKRQSRQNASSGPMLGQGDRLYTPPQPKEPLLSPRIRRILRLWSLGFIGLAFVVMGLINVFSYNAWAVYLGDEFLGHMPINREMEPEHIHYVAVQHRQDLMGAEIVVNERAIIRTARAGRRELYAAPDMVRRISENFTYQVMASAIYVDGERVAVLRNGAEAQHVADEIIRRFVNEHTLQGMSTFEEDWQIARISADAEEMDSPIEVIQLLERPIQDIHRHTIRSGDTQGALAAEFNTTVNMIGYLNDIPSDAILGVGNILLIEVTRPRLTVRTVDEVTYIETIPKEIETIENPNMHVSIYEIINEGRDGEVQVRQRITRLNGVQVGAPEIVYRRELSPAVTRIVEVGTSESAIQVR